jgi:hypothetical protein
MSKEVNMSKLHEKLKDGVYHVVFSGKDITLYRVEKINGEWYYSDGTGWKEKFDYPEAIISAKDVSGIPEIIKDTFYENVYPLTQFFPRKEDVV